MREYAVICGFDKFMGHPNIARPRTLSKEEISRKVSFFCLLLWCFLPKSHLEGRKGGKPRMYGTARVHVLLRHMRVHMA